MLKLLGYLLLRWMFSRVLFVYLMIAIAIDVADDNCCCLRVGVVVDVVVFVRCVCCFL